MTHGVKTYSIGFGLSIVLTLAAFLIVGNDMAHGTALLLALALLAVVQLAVQLFFFLHLFGGPNSRWKLFAFVSAAVVVVIVVAGSMWIMHNLKYNMMPPQATDEYMQQEAQKGF